MGQQGQLSLGWRSRRLPAATPGTGELFSALRGEVFYCKSHGEALCTSFKIGLSIRHADFLEQLPMARFGVGVTGTLVS